MHLAKGWFWSKSSRARHIGRPSLTFQVRSQQKKALCTKGADWGMEDVGSPGQLDTLSMTSWIIVTKRSVLSLLLPLTPWRGQTLPTISIYRQNLRVESAALCCDWVTDFGALCSETVTLVSCCCSQEELTCWKSETWVDLDAIQRSLQKSVTKSTEQHNNQGQCFNFCLLQCFVCWITEMKICFLNRLILVNQAGCEGTVPQGRGLWSCPSDFAKHKSSSQIVNLFLQTNLTALCYTLPTYWHQKNFCIQRVAPLVVGLTDKRSQSSSGHSLKMCQTFPAVFLCWPEVGALKKPLSFILMG